MRGSGSLPIVCTNSRSGGGYDVPLAYFVRDMATFLDDGTLAGVASPRCILGTFRRILQNYGGVALPIDEPATVSVS